MVKKEKKKSGKRKKGGGYSIMSIIHTHTQNFVLYHIKVKRTLTTWTDGIACFITQLLRRMDSLADELNDTKSVD